MLLKSSILVSFAYYIQYKLTKFAIVFGFWRHLIIITHKSVKSNNINVRRGNQQEKKVDYNLFIQIISSFGG